MLKRKRNRPVFAQVIRTGAIAVAMMLAGWVFAAGLHAEAYIAVREGYKCSQCHFNKTGGGKRNDFANVYVQTRLPQYFVQWAPPGQGSSESAVASIYHGRLNDFFSVGADMRFAYAQSDIPNQPTERNTGIRTGLLYFQMDMVPERASFYLDQNVKGAASTRELFLLFDNLAGDSYVKLGQFFLASGFRLQDDTAFVRQYPGFTYGNPDTGIEVGFEPGPWSIGLWSVANDDKHGLIASLVGRGGRIGLSYSVDQTVEGSTKTVRNVFGGAHLGRFTALLEWDEILTESTTTVGAWALLAELNYMFTKGVNLKLSYEAYDPEKGVEGDTVDRASFVYEPFVTQYLQMRFGGRLYTGQTNNDLENRTEIFLEVNTFFY